MSNSQAQPVDLVDKLTDDLMMLQLKGEWEHYVEEYKEFDDSNDFGEWLAGWFEINTENWFGAFETADGSPFHVTSMDEISECICDLIEHLVADDGLLRAGFYYGTDQGWYPFTSHRVATWFDPETAQYVHKTARDY